MSRPAVEICFDYASPFAYLADARVDRELAGLAVDVVRTPVYLRGFEQFRERLPYPAAKAAYLTRDLARCARHYDVPLGAPARMPVNGLYMLRGHVFLEGRPEQDDYRRALFRATWVDGKNTSDAEVVVAVAESIGIDHRELAAGMAQPAVKERLRANTERAIARGAFGVPTLFVGSEMYWGQDRLDIVRRDLEELALGDARMSDVDS
jgi:2-hydroxychromene-2-carboxylate isomerase